MKKEKKEEEEEKFHFPYHTLMHARQCIRTRFNHGLSFRLSKLVVEKKKKRKKKKMNSTLSKEKREGGSCFFPPFFPPFTVLNIELKSQDRDDDPVTERCSGLDDANGILCSERNSFQISLWGIETSPPGTESFFHFLSSASERLLPPLPLPPFSNPTRARASLFLRDGTSHHRRLLGQISISDSSFARKISRDNAFNVSRDVLSRDQTLSSRKQGRDPKGFLLLTDPPSRYTLEPPFPLSSPQMVPSFTLLFFRENLVSGISLWAGLSLTFSLHAFMWKSWMVESLSRPLRLRFSKYR